MTHASATPTITPPARDADPAGDLARRFPGARIAAQETKDGIPTLWVDAAQVHDVLAHLKRGVDRPYRMLYDLTAVDERAREHRPGMPDSDFTVAYHLLSFDRNADVRLKVALEGDDPSLRTVTDLWPSASWYEREVWDLFGVRFDGHPHLRRLLLPPTWKGHPLRKDHPARATEMGPFEMPDDKWLREEEALQFRPEDWGLERRSGDSEFLFLNVGPQHPGTHGVLRLVLQLDGEVIRDCVPDIGFHHRGAEKMGERQTWHTYIPYTDRIDYLAGVQNNLAYLLAVEKLAGIGIPERAEVIRVLVCELYRLASHLVWYGTFAQDVGALSPVFYMFTDRERIFEICEAITGGRMHPSWFRIGGVAADLPEGWEDAVRNLVKYLRRRFREYDGMVMKNSIFKARNVGVGAYTLDEAIDWGVTGPGLRACGMEWDFRKKRPYGGYDRFDFDVPTATAGDGYARAQVRVEEMRQSLRILEQCVERMPGGPVKSDHPLATPPRKERTMHDIETLIHHFLSVSWGPVIPPGEAHAAIEAPKGYYGYWLTSDGGIHSYRTRIRAPSFPHMQMVPMVSRGMLVADLLAYLGSIDFVLADIDR
jgi:NADH-quinone oxidoreductase subunit C/D